MLAVAVAGAAITPVAASAAPVEPDPQVAGIGPAAANDRVKRSSSRSRDVTGDGLPDIVAREPGLNNGSLWVYTNSGSQTFSAKTLVGTGWNTHNWVGVAELTGDTDEYETAAEKPADLIARRASDGALFIYPHSGTLNGGSTFRTAVQVGTGWNSMVQMSVADVTADGFDDIVASDAQDNTWVYPHSGTFNGTQTFKARVLVRKGRGAWDLFPEWRRENPDMVTAFLATGQVLGSAHTNTFKGEDTWLRTSEEIATNIFTHPTTTSVSLLDFTGDGRDDMVRRQPDGKLFLYPFLGWGKNPALGPAKQIGSGWQIMDLIT
jgi:hypothetical protein